MLQLIKLNYEIVFDNIKNLSICNIKVIATHSKNKLFILKYSINIYLVVVL